MAHLTRLGVLCKHLYPRNINSFMSSVVKTGSAIQKKSVSSSSTTLPTEEDDIVVTERQGDIFLIAINRPQHRNAVNRATALRLRRAFEEFDSDKELSVAVFYGMGGTFCAGYDLKELSSFQQYNLSDIKLDPYGPMGPSKMQFSKPVIAAVNGYAVAGGLELSLMCDMRVAEKSANFGVFCRRFGVPLLDGGSVRLPKLIGLSRAMDMILTGRPVSADEAYSFGLANRVVPDGEGLQHAIALAKEVASFPQGCVQADRLSAYYGMYDSQNMDDAMAFEFNNGFEVVGSESVQGATKFAKGQGRSGSFQIKK